MLNITANVNGEFELLAFAVISSCEILVLYNGKNWKILITLPFGIAICGKGRDGLFIRNKISRRLQHQDLKMLKGKD